MQPSHSNPRALLTALEVQELLHIDRSTVYRMAEAGRLPAIRVGRSWRFPADRIEALLDASAPEEQDTPEATPGRDRVPMGPSPSTPALTVVGSAGAGPAPRDASPADPAADRWAPRGTDHPALNTDAAQAAVDVAADLLGVMMLVTDMHGHPITGVANQCTWFAEHSSEPGVLERCIREWRDLADHPDLTPRFQPGALGFECARAFVRHGSTLVGMVLAGGVSPAPSSTIDVDLYHLDEAQRERVLTALPRIAAAISTSPPRDAASTPTAPHPVAPTKENR